MCYQSFWKYHYEYTTTSFSKAGYSEGCHRKNAQCFYFLKVGCARLHRQMCYYIIIGTHPLRRDDTQLATPPTSRIAGHVAQDKRRAYIIYPCRFRIEIWSLSRVGRKRLTYAMVFESSIVEVGKHERFNSRLKFDASICIDHQFEICSNLVCM